MKKKNKLRITAAVSAALLFGGAVLLIKDDVLQEHKTQKLQEYIPPVEVTEQLDEYTDTLLQIDTEEKNDNEDTAIRNEITETITAMDTLPDDIKQSLIDSARSLNSAYPDALGWLYIPNTAISYPIMQSGDNDYYLSHAYDGSYLKAGSVFLDYRCENRFMNPINILYAHNMKNGTMFAGLLNFTDSAYFESRKYGWLAMTETVYRIDFFSCARADRYNMLYDGSVPADQWLDNLRSISLFMNDTDISDDDKFISLSTCSYEFQNARTILTGKLVETIGG